MKLINKLLTPMLATATVIAPVVSLTSCENTTTKLTLDKCYKEQYWFIYDDSFTYRTEKMNVKLSSKVNYEITINWKNVIDTFFEEESHITSVYFWCGYPDQLETGLGLNSFDSDSIKVKINNQLVDDSKLNFNDEDYRYLIIDKSVFFDLNKNDVVTIECKLDKNSLMKNEGSFFFTVEGNVL